MSIVVGYNGSARSRAALTAAAFEAKIRRLPVHVVWFVAHDAGDSPTRAKQEQQASEQIEQELEALRDRLAAEGIEVTTELRHGPRQQAAETLIAAVRERDAQLLVIGMRRRSPVGKLVLGSVSQDVLLAAPCAVLAVKAPSGDG